MRHELRISRLSGIFVLLTVVVLSAADLPEMPTVQDREQVLAGLQQLRSRKLSPLEKGVLDDIEMRCHLLFFLSGTGMGGPASLQVLQDGRQASLIALALFHSSPAKKTNALRAIVSLNDKATVPLLVQALERNNYLAEGSDTVGAHRMFKKELVAAIEKFIEVPLEVTDVDDQRQVVRAIEKAKDWLRGSTVTTQPVTHMPRGPTLPY